MSRDYHLCTSQAVSDKQVNGNAGSEIRDCGYVMSCLMTNGNSRNNHSKSEIESVCHGHRLSPLMSVLLSGH